MEVLALGFVLVVGACSSGAGDAIPSEDGLIATCWSVPEVGDAAERGAPADPRAAAVAAIASRLEDHSGSARFATSTCITLPDGRGDHQASVSDGVADFDRGEFRFLRKSVDPGDPNRIFISEYLVLGERYWARRGQDKELPTDEDPWQGPGPLPTDEPTLYTPWIRGIINGRYEFEEDPYRPSVGTRRQIVDALIAGVEPAGTEDLHGVPTWRYRLTLDKDRAMEQLPTEISSELAWGQYGSPAYRILDVWLDAEGRQRRLVAEAGVLGIPARIGYELWDLDSGFSVRVPADLPGR